MLVEDLLHLSPLRLITAHPKSPIDEAAERMARFNVGLVVIMDDDDHIAGVLSERDIVSGVAEQGPSALDDQVAAHMSRDVVSCQPDDTLAHLMQVMTDRRIRHLPVLEDGKLAGIISIGDVVKRRMDEVEKEADEMRHMIGGG